MTCPTCNGTKTVPQSKRKRHLTRPCPACGGTGETPGPTVAPLVESETKIAPLSTGDRRQSDRDPPAEAWVDKCLIVPLGDGPVVVDMAAILRALGGWATPRE